MSCCHDGQFGQWSAWCSVCLLVGDTAVSNTMQYCRLQRCDINYPGFRGRCTIVCVSHNPESHHNSNAQRRSIKILQNETRYSVDLCKDGALDARTKARTNDESWSHRRCAAAETRRTEPSTALLDFWERRSARDRVQSNLSSPT